jgi:hypothetical protein
VLDWAPLDLRNHSHRECGEARDPQGALLADPGGVMEGEGRYSRSISLRLADEIALNVVAPILREAAVRRTEM